MTFLQNQESLIRASFKHWFGQELLSKALPLFDAPMALLSHGTQTDPILNYGNQVALDLWEMNWDEFTQMPSRLTAEVDVRETRDQLLTEVKTQGWSRNYTGVRISKSGRRFLIEKAIVWNLIDSAGIFQGQAACFEKWSYL